MTSKPLTVKQSAEWLGISSGLMYELVAARRIVHERHGMVGKRGKIVIRLEALEEYRRDQTVAVQEDVVLHRSRPMKLKHLKM